MPNYDYKQGTESGGGLVEPGVHTIQCESAVETQSGAGNDMIKLQCRVDRDGRLVGPKLFQNLVFTPKAWWKIDEVRRACGATIGEGETSVRPDWFVGKRAKVRLVEDGDFLEIAKWLDPEPGAPVEDDDDIPF